MQEVIGRQLFVSDIEQIKTVRDNEQRIGKAVVAVRFTCWMGGVLVPDYRALSGDCVIELYDGPGLLLSAGVGFFHGRRAIKVGAVPFKTAELGFLIRGSWPSGTEVRIEAIIDEHKPTRVEGRRTMTITLEETVETVEQTWDATIRLPDGRYLASSLSDDMPQTPSDAMASAGRMLARNLENDQWERLFEVPAKSSSAAEHQE